MNSNIEYLPAADAGYSPVSAAVSYAQCVNVYVPWMLRTRANTVEIVVRELPYALQLMREACNSLAMPIKFEHDEIVARLGKH